MENTKVFAEMTKAEKFGNIAEVTGITEEQKEFLYKEIETLKKKNSYKSKADKEKDVENAKIESLIVETVKAHNEPIATADIALVVASKLNKYISTQRITPRCATLVANGSIRVEKIKGVNKYTAV